MEPLRAGRRAGNKDETMTVGFRVSEHQPPADLALIERAAKLPHEVKVLHPGPMNRGVEIATQVADGPRSVILEQVKNGVAVRMAILEACA